MKKCCSVCGETKPLDAFLRRAEGKYGRDSRCRECVNAANRGRRAGKKTVRKCGVCAAVVRYRRIFCPACVNAARRAICAALREPWQYENERTDFARRVEIRNRSARGVRCER